MSLSTIFDACKPRADVESGATKDEQFTADLSQVVNGTAPKEYLDAGLFFANSYPTRGLKELLKAVCLRLSGKGGEVSSIIRLGTQYGGGKTHGLIALVHAARGMKGVLNAADFVDAKILPTGPVRIAALDGENTDPANGITLENGLRAYSLWGEMAYRLAGVEGYRRVQASDEKHIAPGADTIRELFGGQPALIMLDEVSVYLRKVERAFPDASKQFAAFVHDLFKAVASTPQVALVYTLAIGKDLQAHDAYPEENERAMRAMQEAESVAARNTTALNPTEEDETADVLRARLFEKIDTAAAKETIGAYIHVWTSNREALPVDAVSPELKEQFFRSYPLHPKLLEMLTEKTASLSTFQRTRGMLRLLARTVNYLWKEQPADAFAIHAHHMDPSFEPIRTEINVKLDQGKYAPAMKSDVAAIKGEELSLAQQLDAKKYPNLPPVTSYLARTIFWHTLAYGDNARGITAEQLKLSVCSPAIEPSFIEQARVAFVTESTYLDDKPGAPLRYMVEPNLTMIIRKRMVDIKTPEIRPVLRAWVEKLFALPRGEFNAVVFPSGPYDVPDDASDERPLLVVIDYEQNTVPADLRNPPLQVEEIFQFKGSDQKLRDLKNNLVFVAAEERGVSTMCELVQRRLALEQLKKPENPGQLAKYQIEKVKGEFETLQLRVAEAILQCYRHLFYPWSSPMPGTNLPIGHTIIELSAPGDSPGNGQKQVERALEDQRKLLSARDTPDAPSFVRDQTGLKVKGEMSTAQLRMEYRRAPKLSILLDDTPLLQCLRNGIEQSLFVYREGNQLWGPGDVMPSIRVSDNCFVHTLEDAKKKHLWPRAEPLHARFAADPQNIDKGGSAELTVTISGGVPPYKISSNEPRLNSAETSDPVHSVRIRPEQSTSYSVDVTDSRGTHSKSDAIVAVREKGGAVAPPLPPALADHPPASAELRAEGPLIQALTEIWEKARKAKQSAISKLTIRMFDAANTWKVHQAVATPSGYDVTCQFEATLEGEGIEEFVVSFRGKVDKANTVKSFLDPQIRAAAENEFKSSYVLGFPKPLSLSGSDAEKLAKDLTRFGAGEAFVEAVAVQAGGAQ